MKYFAMFCLLESGHAAALSAADPDHFYRKPGFVRMEFIRPHAGAVLVYSPSTKRVRLWPFGAGRFPELNLSPSNPLVQSSRKQRVDQSAVGVLLGHMQKLGQGGSLGPTDEQTLAGRQVLHLSATGAGNLKVTGVHRSPAH